MKKTLLIVLAFASFIQTLSAQVTRISDNTNLLAGFPINSSTAVFFQQNTNKLWVTDGTAANTFELAVPVIFDTDGGLAFWNNKLYFSGQDGNGSELWVTDGTVAGTQLVKDIYPGAASGRPTAMLVFNNALYFYANTATYGPELWKSNGTEGGTTLVKDINPGTASSYDGEEQFFEYNNELYFTANTANGIEIWKTNGTEGGTVLLKDIYAGSSTSRPRFLRIFNNALYFTADDGTYGRELWKTNGTEAGTVLVKDIYPGPEGSNIGSLIELDNKLLFSARNFTGNDELWGTDGSEAGTVLIKEINAGLLGSNPTPASGIIINNKLIFAATSLLTGRELYITDGTEVGTTLFKDISPGVTGSEPNIWLDRNIAINPLIGIGNPSTTLFNGKIFFAVTVFNGVIPTQQLWITDGNPANTTLVKDFGLGGLLTTWFYTQSGLYFTANDPTNGIEVFKSAGTPATTNLFADVNTGEDDSFPFFQFFILNGKVFFSADDGNSATDERDLFVVDGTEVALPLRLLNFAGVAETEGVRLDWSTTNEIAVKEFEIERSIDGIGFNAIGHVKATGNSTAVKNYGYLDRDAYQKNSLVLYYRLKIKDENLKTAYSPVVMIRLNAPLTKGLQLAPNPARNFVRLNYTSDMQQEAQLRILNNNGQVVKSVVIRLFKGTNQQVIDLNQMAPGLYHVELLIKGKAIESIRFMKQ